MTNILLTLSYDGTDFCGWQRQDKSDGGKSVRTVQGVVEDALKKMLGVHVDLQGSGRTDSGVHAAGQAANFVSPYDTIPAEKYTLALNGFLPRDIRIINSEVRENSFSARYNATSRVYRYFIHTVSVPQAKDMRYVWYIPFKPETALLNSMCSCLSGELDCATFAAAGDMSVSTKRYLEQAHFWYEGDVLVFEIEANAFLWKMVRSLTGTLVTGAIDVIKDKCDAQECVEQFKKKVYSCDRAQAGLTAPPQGLFLYQVKFDGIRRHV